MVRRLRPATPKAAAGEREGRFMIGFAVDVSILIVATYIVGCAGGCWLRRTLARRSMM